jgi:hypothetical protein
VKEGKIMQVTPSMWMRGRIGHNEEIAQAIEQAANCLKDEESWLCWSIIFMLWGVRAVFVLRAKLIGACMVAFVPSSIE